MANTDEDLLPTYTSNPTDNPTYAMDLLYCGMLLSKVELMI